MVLLRFIISSYKNATSLLNSCDGFVVFFVFFPKKKCKYLLNVNHVHEVFHFLFMKGEQAFFIKKFPSSRSGETFSVFSSSTRNRIFFHFFGKFFISLNFFIMFYFTFIQRKKEATSLNRLWKLEEILEIWSIFIKQLPLCSTITKMQITGLNIFEYSCSISSLTFHRWTKLSIILS